MRTLISKPNPIFILDLKGDPALFHTTKEEAEARGRSFFSLAPDKIRRRSTLTLLGLFKGAEWEFPKSLNRCLTHWD